MSRRVLPLLGFGAESRAPRPELRKRLVSLLEQEVPQEVFIKASAGPWQHAAMPGLSLRYLFRGDAPRYTALARLAAGVSYPGHRHAGVEELYMLEGDLVVDGVKMGPQDYCAARPGTIHQEIYSEKGGIFVVTSSQDDEVFDNPASLLDSPQALASPDGILFNLEAQATWDDLPSGRTRLLFSDNGAKSHVAEIDRGEYLPAPSTKGSQGPRQLYVLSGTLQAEGRTLSAGDFLYTATPRTAIAGKGTALVLGC